ncbi:MAG TPA: hypothetical protein VLM40_03690 [Gemmata sp.]|nr:hypothetical protein [Gemmata sp.]
MKPEHVLIGCIAGVIWLLPLSVYLFTIARITRRDHPTVVSGPWDFVGVILGLSGFIVFGGGLVLALAQSNFRYSTRGNLEAFRDAWHREGTIWILISAAYLLLVVGIVALTLFSRRRSLVIYNVDPTVFEGTITEVFEHMGRPIERRGNLWSSGTPLFELDRFVGGHTVTLRWVSDDRRLFEEVERLLREALRDVESDENVASRWLMACAGGLGFWAMCCIGLLFVYVFSSR